jgi:hypothetical protein
MTNDERNDALRLLLQDPESRRKLAASMVSPIRCGGSGYEGDRYYLLLGGRKVFTDTEEYQAILRARGYGALHR